MRIITLLLIGLLSLPLFSDAKDVSVIDAKRVAKNFYYQNAKNLSNKSYDDINLTVDYIETDGSNLFYVFGIENLKGFVVTSAQDFVKPILGFSDQDDIDFSNLSPELKFMLDGYAKQINFGIENNVRATKEVAAKWQSLQIQSVNRTSVVDTEGPLILTNWNQSPHYEDLCPTDANGNHAVVGCVAVAMAQIMKYYDYPSQGEGTNYYNDNSGNVHDASNINYGNETYAWANMPTSIGGENLDVAKLMYHCGQTTHMDWEVASSGTQTSYVVSALKDHFRYSSSAQEYYRETWTGSLNYTDAEWEQMIRDEIDLLRPILYSGFSDDGGHAWDCDGYRTDNNGDYLYHMNYGWGGYGNGWFALDQLLSGTTPGGDDYYFDHGHQIITGIYPETNYPENCVGTKTITGFEGLISDGSGSDLYQNNLNCNTIIQPECARGKVMLTFNKFDLAPGDEVYLYDGISSSDDIIAVLSSDNLPGTEQFTSSNNGMLVRFYTNSSGRAAGWDASYTSSVCSAITSTRGEGTMTDGSGTCDYETGAYCNWYITPPGATQITLNFTEFDLDTPDHDYVQVYDNVTGDLIGTYKMSTPPPSNLVINSSEVKIRFRSYTSETNVGAGWSVDYTSDVVGIDHLIDFDELVKVYPNPFKSDAFVKISNPNQEPVRILITDLVGKKLIDKTIGDFSGTKTISISELGRVDFKTGIYLLNVQIGNQTKTYKLISE